MASRVTNTSGHNRIVAALIRDIARQAVPAKSKRRKKRRNRKRPG